MSDSKETAVLGYITGVAFLAVFFWLTLGDAYGRVMIGFNPAKSIMSDELALYTGDVTGLVCLVAPFLLAYLPRYVIGHWIQTGWAYSARAGLWIFRNGRKLLLAVWYHASRAVNSMWVSVSGRLHERR